MRSALTIRSWLRHPVRAMLLGLVAGAVATLVVEAAVVGPLALNHHQDLPLERQFGSVAVSITARPLVVPAVLIDWAWVAVGIHHVVDVVGSTVFVALAAIPAIRLARLAMYWLMAHLPMHWDQRRLLPARER